MIFDKDKMLDEIFGNDPLGLLQIKPSSSPARNADERLVSSFEEINSFFEANSKEPEQSSDISERTLYARLKGIRASEEKIEMLKDFDRFNLLTADKLPKEIHSLDDILDDDLLGLLSNDDVSLFDLKHVPTKEEMDKEREATDFVARRKPCKDFDKFEDKLKEIQKDLANGKRKLIDFKMGDLRPNNYYINNGILFYLESVNFSRKEHYREDGTRVREDGRTRCIFENGTESNMLFRSVSKALYENGKVVTNHIDAFSEDFAKSFGTITEEDEEAGFIYILKSKSTKEEIREIQHLYKIGYSTTSVEDRLKNAEKEPTYLMAPVDIVAVYQAYNMNTQKFEQLLHNFFGKACLNIDVFDDKGKRHTPQEWFIAPIDVIDRAVELIITGEIVGYDYDFLEGRVKSKQK